MAIADGEKIAAASPGGENGAALSGVRVIEIGQLIAGPFCGQLLADFGAEVIKIETIIRDLAARADILVENFRPRT